LLIFEIPGALNQICHSAPWISDPTADGAWVHHGPGRGRGPWVHRGPPLFKRRGTRSQPSARDLTVLDECVRRAAVKSPGTGAARRRAAAHRRRKLWGELPAVFSCISRCYTQLGGLRTHLGVQWWGSGFYGGRRRKGAEPPLRRARAVGAVLKRERKRRGQFCSPRRGNGSEHKVDGEALRGSSTSTASSGGGPADGVTAQLGPEATRCPWSKERGREISHACTGEEGRETGYFTVGDCSGGGGNRGDGAVELGSGTYTGELRLQKGRAGACARA
jgi:hypothetical protein